MQTQYYSYGRVINATDFPVLKVHVTDFPFIQVYVDQLSSARISQHKLCATLSASVNVNCRLLIKVYYRICTVEHIRIEIIHGNQHVCCVWTWVGRILVNVIPRYSSGLNTNIRQPMLKLKAHFGIHDLFLK